MSKSHNKKRNIGLIYEFLISTISRALVEGDTKKSTSALKILKRHFKPGTELYKEFRIVNALCKTTVSSEAIAANIINEAKSAVRSHNTELLFKQKTSLIHDINHNLIDENFFDQHVNEYRLLATIQTLFEDWRAKQIDLQRVGQYEEQILQHLISKKDQKCQDVTVTESIGEGRLLMKVMMKKLNEKYSGVLTTEQKSLLRAYAFSTASDDPESIRLKLRETRNSLVTAIDSYIEKHGNDSILLSRLNEARQLILSESIDVVDDNTVTKFLQYTELTDELTRKEVDNV
jgi:hypothetical protein